MNILSIGEKIRKKRKELGMTLKDLAGSRITTGQISLIESGKSNPSMDLLEYIAKNLKTSVEYLLESEEKQAIKICRYYENIAFCNLFRKDWENVEYFLSKMKSIAEKYFLEEIEYKIYFIKGLYMYHLKNYDDAVQNILIGNLGFLKFSMSEYIIQSFLYLTYISMEKENYISAIVHLNCIIKIIENQLFDQDYIRFKVYYLAWISYLNIGKIDESKFYLHKAMEVLDGIYRPKDSGILFMEKSFEFMKSEDIDNAIMFSNTSRKYFEKFENLRDVKNIEIKISKHLIENNNFDCGEKYLKRARAITYNYEFEDEIKIYSTFIDLYLKNGNLKKAKDYLKRFRKILNVKNISEVLEFYTFKYELYILEKEYKQAEDIMNFLCDFCLEFGEYKKAGSFYLKLYKLYVETEKFEDAKDAINKAKAQYKKGGCKILF